ncbi:MAG: universal stress protein [Sandaracinaceae bacterium]|nr:universal stress protein [Sandaracinaceae bacterium]
MRYQHILGATDFSEHGDLALRSAAELAAANQGEADGDPRAARSRRRRAR